MAKLSAPLFSFSASGKIAGALVYFGWKGLKVVRQYVIPANPKTALQQAQRAFVTAAVAAIHAAQVLATDPLDQEDIMAYSLWGTTRPTPRTWFNEIVKNWIDVELAAKVPVIYSNGTVSVKTPAAITMILTLNEKTGSTLAAGKFYFGSSKTALIHAATATVVAGVSVGLTAEDCSAYLTAGVKAYWQFKPDVADGCEGALSGIYTLLPA